MDNKLIPGDVLVEGNMIKSLGKSVRTGPDAHSCRGMIDGHAHVMINAHFDAIEKDIDFKRDFYLY